jgi:hypothetical protein
MPVAQRLQPSKPALQWYERDEAAGTLEGDDFQAAGAECPPPGTDPTGPEERRRPCPVGQLLPRRRQWADGVDHRYPVSGRPAGPDGGAFKLLA